MNTPFPIARAMITVPALVDAAGESASMRFLETRNIRNLHTRRAHASAAAEFLRWCASVGMPTLAAVQPVHVATWIEAGTRELGHRQKGRIFGTFIGLGAGIAASALGSHLAFDLSGQIAVSVGLCAAMARQYPAVRVCMWTGPIVLLTAEPSTAVVMVAFFRGNEVMIGVLVGAALHWTAEVTVLRTLHRAGDTGLE